jgi:hypothetical protein
MPSTWHPSRRATTHDGAASDSPNIRVSSGCGTSEKQRTHGPPSISSVWSAPEPRASTVRRPTRLVGTTARSAVVPNTTGSASGERRVATSVPAGYAHDVPLGCREPEGHRHAGRGRREQPDADQLQKLDVVQVGHPVQPVHDLVGHGREGLDQGHARVGDVVVGPLRAALLHHPLGVVDEVLEPAVVQVGHRQAHSSCSGIE